MIPLLLLELLSPLPVQDLPRHGVIYATCHLCAPDDERTLCYKQRLQCDRLHDIEVLVPLLLEDFDKTGNKGNVDYGLRDRISIIEQRMSTMVHRYD